jgi:hypothetical protein
VHPLEEPEHTEYWSWHRDSADQEPAPTSPAASSCAARAAWEEVPYSVKPKVYNTSGQRKFYVCPSPPSYACEQFGIHHCDWQEINIRLGCTNAGAWVKAFTTWQQAEFHWHRIHGTSASDESVKIPYH